jgi:hypothetical protein
MVKVSFFQPLSAPEILTEEVRIELTDLVYGWEKYSLLKYGVPLPGKVEFKITPAGSVITKFWGHELMTSLAYTLTKSADKIFGNQVRDQYLNVLRNNGYTLADVDSIMVNGVDVDWETFANSKIALDVTMHDTDDVLFIGKDGWWIEMAGPTAWDREVTFFTLPTIF